MAFVLMTKCGNYLQQTYTNNHGPRRETVIEVPSLNHATVFKFMPKSREFKTSENELVKSAFAVGARRISYIELTGEPQ